MLIAGSFELNDLISAVRGSRSVFHSEADFQHELAWQAHLLDRALRVRLETRPDPALREQLDVLLERPDLGESTVIELKYLKAAWEGESGGERFSLRNIGAHDIVRYDVVKDLARVERFVAGRPGSNGLVMVLTNDSLHWREPQFARDTIAEAFRIHDGTVLTGARSWGTRAGDGTTRGRAEALVINGSYPLSWRPYSKIGGSRNGEFRLLVIEVERTE